MKTRPIMTLIIAGRNGSCYFLVLWSCLRPVSGTSRQPSPMWITSPLAIGPGRPGPAHRNPARHDRDDNRPASVRRHRVPRR